MEVSDQFHEPTALTPVAIWQEAGWRTRIGLDAVAKRENTSLLLPVVQPVA